MKTIEIKEDGKVIKTAYLQKHGGTFAPDSLKLGGENFWMMDEPPFLYKDHNGNEVMNGQSVWKVQTVEVPYKTEDLWNPFESLAHAKEDACFTIFTTKDAADQFVVENRPHMIISEDGVKMYDRSGVWCVHKDRFIKTLGVVSSYMIDSFFYFSTEQAANDYIKRHKAVLSLDMIEKGLTDEGHEWSNPVVQEVFRTLTKLVNEQFKPQ